VAANSDQEYCQKHKAGIYSHASLGPPKEVRQVEIEAGDCEGRLPFLFGASLKFLVLLVVLAGRQKDTIH
jgi:hypothetical protein